MILVGLILIAVVLFILAAAIISSVLGIVLFVVVAALCGAAAEYLLGEPEGVGETVLIGIIGAALGAILAHLLHLPPLIAIAGLHIVWTIVGALIVVALLKVIRPSLRQRRLLG